MSAENPISQPEKKEVLSDDNALKFTLEGIDPEFLQQNDTTSFLLITDWLEMGDASEQKLVRKEYPNGDIKLLFIQKFTKDSKRTVPPKKELTLEEYQDLLASSRRRVEKVRHEFDYSQNGITFSMKYDEFVKSHLRILEVDAENEAKRELFTDDNFPYELTNVTGQMEYYGYRVAELV